MNQAGSELGKNIISNLIVPAFGVRDGVIVCANKSALALLPRNVLGEKVCNVFPESRESSGYANRQFDVFSIKGISSAKVSPLLDLELWQLTPERSEQDVDKIIQITKTEINLLFAEVNLLQRLFSDREGLFSSVYQNCCRLLKATSLNSDSGYTPVMTVFDLSKEVLRFVEECREVFLGLKLTVERDEIRRFTYISADRNILDDIFSGVLCLCSHAASRGGEITVSVTEKDSRALFSFTVTDGGGSPSENTLSEGDRALTDKLLKKNLKRLNGNMFSVSDGERTSYVISFPIASEDDVFTDFPVFPTPGIPPYLIQLSALLPPEFYSRLK